MNKPKSAAHFAAYRVITSVRIVKSVKYQLKAGTDSQDNWVRFRSNSLYMTILSKVLIIFLVIQVILSDFSVM